MSTTASSLTVASLTGADLAEALDDLARLRIRVFRDFPYLYDGTPDYEAEYLSVFANGKDGLIVAARDGGTVIGCATGSALTAHHAEFAEPFLAHGYKVDDIFYCGESVLLPEYRGRGLGHIFFDRREAHARARGYKFTTFSSVVRPADHSMRPANYRPLDEFWQKRGYRKLEGVTASFGWKEIGQKQESPHAMQFWMREL
jgi:GNAT superfamily N-acetyltransferase